MIPVSRRLGAVLLMVVAAGCNDGAQHAQHEIIATHVPDVQRIVRSDIEAGVVGVTAAGQRLAPGFVIEDPARREREMRSAIMRLRQPPRGIRELMISPISFVAAVGTDGRVICRDAEQDQMVGFDAGASFEVVRRALSEGYSGYALSEFPSLMPDQPPSHTVLYVAPARRDGRIVGAVIAGTPLWRTAQRLSRQVQLDHAAEMQQSVPLIVWVYLYRGDELFHHGTPADLDAVMPDGAARAAGFARSPGGFTGELVQYGRWYGYGVVPLPRIGPDVGAIIVRSDPG